MSRKQKIKIYHGLQKSHTDSGTMFYASFNGDTKSPINSILEYNLNDSSIKYVDSATGYALLNNSSVDYISYIADAKGSNVITIDFITQGLNSNNSGQILRLYAAHKTDTYLRVAILDDMTIHCDLIVEGTNKYNWVSFKNITDFNKGFNHVRIVISPQKLLFFINGKNYKPTNNLADYDFFGFAKTIIPNIKFVRCYNRIAICDLHISNIDRGDYFSNLPQDFIEGKSIINTMFNQQQCKGDPLIAQKTSIVIPAYIDEKTKLYRVNSSSVGTLISNPEITNVTNASTWDSQSKFTIRGLNSEIVGGVTDDDTALARVISYDVNSNFVTVDSVSKLSVGDTIQFIKGDGLVAINSVRTIIEINGNTLTLNGALTVSGATHLVETTPTSSSPIVKTIDGINVNGTWTGLGTSEATFSLGQNEQITGKDLLVTYSLNMPSGNSQIPGIPYSIDAVYDYKYDQLEKVSEIIIEDDFRGKKSGDTEKCPHISKSLHTIGLGNITNYFSENSDSNYHSLSYIDDDTRIVNKLEANWLSQQLFAFNVIRIIEDKIGAICDTDKISWLKNNVNYIKFTHYGNGICPSGNKIYCVSHDVNTAKWSTDVVNHNKSEIFTLSKSVNPKDSVDNDGFVYFAVYTDPSDGVIQSQIFTDYVKVEVALKSDPNFEIFFTKNKRARENKCNPILVQKQTKTIKRYFNNSENFVTEVSLYPYESEVKTNVIGEYLLIDTRKVITSSGTGQYIDKDINGSKVSYAGKIPLPSGMKWSDLDNSPIRVSPSDDRSLCSNSVVLPVVRHWGGRSYAYEGNSSAGLDSYKTIDITADSENVNLIEFYPALKTISSEVYLCVLADKRLPGNSEIPRNSVTWNYRLPNRPLIK